MADARSVSDSRLGQGGEDSFLGSCSELRSELALFTIAAELCARHKDRVPAWRLQPRRLANKPLRGSEQGVNGYFPSPISSAGGVSNAPSSAGTTAGRAQKARRGEEGA